MSVQICKEPGCLKLVPVCYHVDGYCEDHWVDHIGKKVKGGLRLRYYGGKPKHHGQGKRNDLTEPEAA